MASLLAARSLRSLIAAQRSAVPAAPVLPLLSAPPAPARRHASDAPAAPSAADAPPITAARSAVHAIVSAARGGDADGAAAKLRDFVSSVPHSDAKGAVRRAGLLAAQLADKGDAKGAEKLLDTLEALAAEAKGADRAEWTRHAIKAAAAVAGPDAAVRMLREALREAAVAKDGDAGNPGVDRDWVFSLALSALRRGKPDTATALLDAALKSRVRFRLPKPAVDQLARFGPAKGDDKTRWWLREWARLRNKPGAAEILRGPPTPDAPARVRFAHAARNGDPAAAEHFAAACADPLAQPYQIGSLLRVAARHAPLDTIREMRPHLAALPEGKHPGGDAVLKAASAALGSGRRQEAEEVLMMAAGQLHRHEDVLPAPGVEEGEAAARAWAGRAAETLAWTAGAPGSGVEFGHGGQRFSWN